LADFPQTWDRVGLGRDLALVMAGAAGMLLLADSWDWPFLAVTAALVVSAATFVVLRHLPPRQPVPMPVTDGPAAKVETEAALAAAPRAVLDALSLPVLVLDEERRILLANLAARDLLGPEIEGRSLLSVLRQPPLLAALETLGSGERPAPFDLAEINGHALAAELVPIEGQPSLGPGQAASLIVFHDVSGLKRAESLRSDFVANVSHELKTPLATLIGFLETLKGPARNDEQARARFIDIMLAEAQRMSRIVADLLSLSRIELNELQPPEGRANLKRIAGSVIDGLGLRAKERGIVLRLAAPDRVPDIPGDADELTQVLQNLIDNALKYSRDQALVTVEINLITDPALLRLNLPQQRSAPAAIALSVRDQGPGIAREHIPRLTERFYRIDNARSREMGGTGLGLAIVKHIINRHRGKLEIQSVLGQGSVFTIYLPMDSLPAAPAPVLS
jgi:two-component system phosphate regulon sensor histidine kinase PhoR